MEKTISEFEGEVLRSLSGEEGRFLKYCTHCGAEVHEEAVICVKCGCSIEQKKVVAEVLETPGFVFCEIFTDTEQVWEPKSSTKRLEDGTLVSPPLEDLAPFLPREEVLSNLYIKAIEE